MIEGIVGWWRLRTSREQRLLLVMLALIVLVAGWLLVIRPLSDGLDRAQRRHGDAVSALAEARARAEASRALHRDGLGAAPLPVDAFLSRTATEAGFTGARIAGQGPSAAIIAIDAARPQAFFAWVRLMERRGLVVRSLSARTNQDQTLAVEAEFRARTG
ncbi:MAG TPA: type II secretion system protein GspM [Allosphingosinicella sp.]|nr:type II secretion system protein GspM [Allosphingosinicella sp.]